MTTEQDAAIQRANTQARLAKRSEFRVELYVDAIDEKAVWAFLKQLQSIPGVVGLIEEPIVQEDCEVNEEKEESKLSLEISDRWYPR